MRPGDHRQTPAPWIVGLPDVTALPPDNAALVLIDAGYVPNLRLCRALAATTRAQAARIAALERAATEHTAVIDSMTAHWDARVEHAREMTER